MSSAALILRIDRTRYQAMVSGNVALLDALLADDLVYTHANGRRESKAGYIALLRNKLLCYSKIRHSVEHVTIKNDIAIITGSLMGLATVSGVTTRLNAVTTSLWTREQDQWRLSIFHTTQTKHLMLVQ